MLILKDYQQRSLDALKSYYQECSKTGNADLSFYSSTIANFGSGIPYKKVNELPGLPYVCIRIPTGGGKTLVASHAVGIAASELLHSDNTLVLWLVPSNTIREQTLKALKGRRHPYRQALDSFSENVSVLDIEEALYLNRADVDGGTVIIVSTMQAFRREKEIGLRVYKSSGRLMDHFNNIPPEVSEKLDKGEEGNIHYSLANVLYMRRPIVIVDEAHNARTDLSFETLARFNPSCIIEFTATPAQDKNPSNVLYSVSAAELKAENMIKMPIRLEARPDWRELLSDAIARLKNLEKSANLERQQTGEYIRPIMLIQAQHHSKGKDTISVETILETLVNDNKIPREEIAIATGDQDELYEIDDIRSQKCPIRYIITMQKLREGWDCHFAYVLCSVADVKSNTAVEQIIGRVMRLPNASRKNIEDLNMAYAFASSKYFAEAANMLKDALIQNGFERQEAEDLIIPEHFETQKLDLNFDQLDKMSIDLPEMPVMDGLPDSIKEKVIFDPDKKKLIIKGVIDKDERDMLKNYFQTPEGKEKIDIAFFRSHGMKGTPAERRVPFAVPWLAIKQGSLIEAFEETHFLDHPWELSKCDALLTSEEFSEKRTDAEFGEIDTNKDGKITRRFIPTLQNELANFTSDKNWAVSDLAVWLDRKIAHKDITPSQSGIFLTRMIQSLIDQRGMKLEKLVNDKYRLKNAAEAKINKYRSQFQKKSYQGFLDGIYPDQELIVSPECCFSFPLDYPVSKRCEYDHEFEHHYYAEIGYVNGEEFDCARFLDSRDYIDTWVRNLERRPSHSFWLQTSTDKFYPDFVCRLKDGRYLVVEYKGEDRWSNDDSKEKLNIGEFWAKQSNGLCLFVMPKGKDFEAITKLIKEPRGKAL